MKVKFFVCLVLFSCLLSVLGASVACEGQDAGTCTALIQDDFTEKVTLDAGGVHHFHYVLTDYSIIDVPDNDRPRITFQARPCSGDVKLYINPVTTFPTGESDAIWKSENTNGINEVSVKFSAAQYYVTIIADTAAQFEMGTFINKDSYFPDLSRYGTTVLVAPSPDNDQLDSDDPMTMDLSFITGPDATYQYAVWTVKHEENDSTDCGLTNPLTHQCLVNTVCGLYTNGQVAIDFDDFEQVYGETVPINTNITISVPNMENGVTYTFNVLAKTTKGEMLAYSGAKGKSEITRETQAQSSSTMMIVLGSIFGFVVIILIAVVILTVRFKKQVLKKYEERRMHGRNRYANLVNIGEKGEQPDTSLQEEQENDKGK
eukprot:TRINITY_DN778198_c0_g1_i1.p1 TRINITY_DN778198_c0_g1~~TRINITY_DN778198_c0_g1_i1.p1  ORF type:complete len:374 (+),score=94.25 TRINITY_DN778198_c0_g1_i1:89-1210(+)